MRTYFIAVVLAFVAGAFGQTGMGLYDYNDNMKIGKTQSRWTPVVFRFN